MTTKVNAEGKGQRTAFNVSLEDDVKFGGYDFTKDLVCNNYRHLRISLKKFTSNQGVNSVYVYLKVFKCLYGGSNLLKASETVLTLKEFKFLTEFKCQETDCAIDKLLIGGDTSISEGKTSSKFLSILKDYVQRYKSRMFCWLNHVFLIDGNQGVGEGIVFGSSWCLLWKMNGWGWSNPPPPQ